MIFGRNGITSADAEQDFRWRTKAWFWFVLAIVIAVATPHLAQQWVEHHWAAVSSSVIKFVVRDWIEIYAISAVVTLVLFELGHYLQLHGRQETAPFFMEQMLHDLAKKANIPTPLLIYEPGKKVGAATSSSLFSGSKVYWLGDYSYFSKDQINAVLAHEVAHIAMGDVPTMLVKHLFLGGLRVLAIVQLMVALIALTVSFLGLFPWVVGTFVLVFPVCYALFARSEESIWAAGFAIVLLAARFMSPEVTAPLVFAFTTSFVGTVLSVIASHAYSRVIEYRADAVAIDLMGKSYIDALATALKIFFRLRLNTKRKRQLYKNMPELLMTHPRIVDRIIELQKRKLRGFVQWLGFAPTA